MGAAPDHYRRLGVKSSATADEIRHAYRAAAKRAHPDAGGNAVAMQAVSEAYHTLIDPATRRDYDHERERANRPPEPPPARHHTASSSTDSSGHHVTHHRPADAPAHAYTAAEAAAAQQLEYDQYHHHRLRAARILAWDMLKYALLMTFLLGVATRYYAIQFPDPRLGLFLSVVSFIPAYFVSLAIAFLLRPGLRLLIHDLPRDKHRTRQETATFLALVLSWIPLLIIWVVWLWHIPTLSL